MMRLKRVYEKPFREDGLRILVDRLWPLGLFYGAGAAAGWKKLGKDENMVVVDRLNALFETERAGRDTLSHLFYEAHTPARRTAPRVGQRGSQLDTLPVSSSIAQSHSSSACGTSPSLASTRSATGSSSRAETVVIGGGVLTLYCIARFGLQYHRGPSDDEVVAPTVHGADVRGKEA